jgi:DNA-binding MarR family transcriptional regulator
MDDHEHIGLLVAAVRRRIKQAVGKHVRRYRLTTQQFWVLVAISEHPGVSLGELAAHLRMDKPTASRVVFALMKRKLVQVKRDPTDRRRARLCLGSPGAAMGQELRELAAAVRAAVVRGFNPSEQAALRVALRRIAANMERFQDGDSADMRSRMRSQMSQLRVRREARAHRSSGEDAPRKRL